MKKTELNNLEEKKTTNGNLRASVDNSSKNKNLSQDQEKTQEAIDYINATLGDGKIGEEAEIEEINISEQMDEIIKINDKFTLVESILYLLCKELEIPDRSQPGAIGAAIKALYESHYKSMENWKNIKNLSKNGNR